MKKTTDFTLQELLGVLQSGCIRGCGGHRLHSGGGFPIGQIVNDVAAIFINDDNIEAGAALVGLLTNSQVNARFIAFCALKTGESKLLPDMLKKLEAFSSDPANSEVIEAAKERLAAVA
ncbi:MAG: hypothetical protein WC726_00610 [Parcubacteria group bacterium]